MTENLNEDDVLFRIADETVDKVDWGNIPSRKELYRSTITALMFLLKDGKLVFSRDCSKLHISYSMMIFVDSIPYIVYKTNDGNHHVFSTLYSFYTGYFDSKGHFVYKSTDEKHVLGFDLNLDGLYKKIKKYLCRPENLFKRILVPFKQQKKFLLLNTANLGHHIWNEQTAIDFLLENDLLQNVDKVISIYDYFNVKKYFSEILNKPLCFFRKNRYFTTDIIIRPTNFLFSSVTQKRILDWSIKNRAISTKNLSDKFIINLELRTTSRIWKNEADNLAMIINKLNSKFNNLHFYISGFCKDISNEKIFKDSIKKDLQEYNEIYDKLERKDNIDTTIGYSCIDKIAILEDCVLFITPFGSSEHINWIINKPAISYGPSVAYDLSSCLMSPQITTDVKMDVIYFDKKFVKEYESCDYELNVDKLYSIIEDRVKCLNKKEVEIQ